MVYIQHSVTFALSVLFKYPFRNNKHQPNLLCWLVFSLLINSIVLTAQIYAREIRKKFLQLEHGKENFPKLRFQYLQREKVMRRINLLLRTNKVNIVEVHFFDGNNFCENVDQAVSKIIVIWKLQCLACHFEILQLHPHLERKFIQRQILVDQYFH